MAKVRKAISIDETLTPDNAVDVCEEILRAQKKAIWLGLKLRLQPVEVDNIRDMHPDLSDFLLHIIIAFINQAEPRPTWSVIIEALRSPAVNLSALANEVEAAHSSSKIKETLKPVKPRRVPPIVLPSPEQGKLKPSLRRIKSSPSSPGVSNIPKTPQQMTTTEKDASTSVAGALSGFSTAEIEKDFTHLKNTIRECLEKQSILVTKVAGILASLSPCDYDSNYNMFPESREVIATVVNQSELFGTMNYHWNYLNPHLLYQLVKELKLKEVKEVKTEMERYESDLRKFRKTTSLVRFCKIQERKKIKICPENQEMVTEFYWPGHMTLEDLEQFRLEYTSHYNLHEFAVMIAHVLPGSFIVTWFIPHSVTEMLKKHFPREIFKKFFVKSLEIAGACFYRSREPKKEVSVSPSTSGGGTASPASVTATVPGELKPSPEDYLFVKEPPKHFFCQVTMALLLQPFLTSCCGKHLSEEAVPKTKKPCPLCKEECMTMLDKYFRREVMLLPVFCRHNDGGCEWQGAVDDFDDHVKSCAFGKTNLGVPKTKGEERSGSRTGHEEPRSLTELHHKFPLHATEQLAGDKQLCSKRLELKVTRVNTIKEWCKMEKGSAATDGRFAYFISRDCKSTTPYYSFRLSDKKSRNIMPSCCYRESGLVIINDKVTTVGGKKGDQYTDKLLTLRSRKWVEELPPMKYARSWPAAVATSNRQYIVVIGGYIEGNWTNKVELFQVVCNKWYDLKGLPKPNITRPSAAICDSLLYVIGTDTKGYSCSLEDLPSKLEPLTSTPSLVWKSLPPLPVRESTAASLNGQLVIIGGRKDALPVSSIHQLWEGKWEKIGSLTSCRDMCLVVTPSTNKVLVTGGHANTRNTEEYIYFDEIVVKA